MAYEDAQVAVTELSEHLSIKSDKNSRVWIVRIDGRIRHGYCVIVLRLNDGRTATRFVTDD